MKLDLLFRNLFVLASAAFALALTSCGDDSSPTGVPEPTREPYAEVSLTRAEFIFPLNSTTDWAWYLESTPTNQLEYMWSVSLNFGPGAYQFGLYLFKLGDPSPSNGGIHELIEDGQETVFWIVDEKSTAIRDTEIEVTVEDESLVIVMEHPRTMGLVLADRPGTVVFRTIAPGGHPTSEVVPVRYVP